MSDSSGRGAVGVVADMDLSVTTERGTAVAHLGNEGDHLVLDVDRPAVFLNALPRSVQRPWGRWQRLDIGVPLVIRSQSRDLGRIRVTPAGRVRLRPTFLGLRTAGRMVLSGRHLGSWALGAAVALAAFTWGRPAAGRRSAGQST